MLAISEAPSPPLYLSGDDTLPSSEFGAGFQPSSQSIYKNCIPTVGYPTLASLTRAMAGAEELPAYITMVHGPSPTPNLPPSYNNTSFTIGSWTVSCPLVSIGQLKSHLRLLGIFMLMKQKVENPDSNPCGTIPPLARAPPPEERWVWFLELAVERYVLVLAGAP